MGEGLLFLDLAVQGLQLGIQVEDAVQSRGEVAGYGAASHGQLLLALACLLWLTFEARHDEAESRSWCKAQGDAARSSPVAARRRKGDSELRGRACRLHSACMLAQTSSQGQAEPVTWLMCARCHVSPRLGALGFGRSAYLRLSLAPTGDHDTKRTRSTPDQTQIAYALSGGLLLEAT